MKFINKRKERKGCTTFTTRIASKSKTLLLKRSKEVSRPNPRAPWKVVCARNAKPGRAEIGSSICSSRDVGQCVTSSKRWIGIRRANNSKAGETGAKLKRFLWRTKNSPKTSISVLFSMLLSTEENALLTDQVSNCPINWSCVSQH